MKRLSIFLLLLRLTFGASFLSKFLKKLAPKPPLYEHNQIIAIPEDDTDILRDEQAESSGLVCPRKRVRPSQNVRIGRNPTVPVDRLIDEKDGVRPTFTAQIVNDKVTWTKNNPSNGILPKVLSKKRGYTSQ